MRNEGDFESFLFHVYNSARPGLKSRENPQHAERANVRMTRRLLSEVNASKFNGLWPRES